MKDLLMNYHTDNAGLFVKDPTLIGKPQLLHTNLIYRYVHYLQFTVNETLLNTYINYLKRKALRECLDDLVNPELISIIAEHNSFENYITVEVRQLYPKI